MKCKDMVAWVGAFCLCKLSDTSKYAAGICCIRVVGGSLNEGSDWRLRSTKSHNIGTIRNDVLPVNPGYTDVSIDSRVDFWSKTSCTIGWRLVRGRDGVGE